MIFAHSTAKSSRNLACFHFRDISGKLQKLRTNLRGNVATRISYAEHQKHAIRSVSLLKYGLSVPRYL